MYFDGQPTVEINTTSCVLLKKENVIFHGEVKERTLHWKHGSWNHNVCKISYDNAIKFGKDVNLTIRGENALNIESKTGQIEVFANIKITAGACGGYTKENLDGVNAGEVLFIVFGSASVMNILFRAIVFEPCLPTGSGNHQTPE